MQWCVPICVPADPAIFMSSVNQIFCNVVQSESSGEVQGGIAIVFVIGILDGLGVVLRDAFEECKIP